MSQDHLALVLHRLPRQILHFFINIPFPGTVLFTTIMSLQSHIRLCLVILCWTLGFAIMPPHPDLLKEEIYQADRAEWHRQLSSNPRSLELLHPDACQYVSIEECLQADDFMLRQASSLRSQVMAKGHLRSLVLLMRFQDHKDRALPSRDEINLLLNGEGTDPILYPTGSVAEYFKVNSYEQLSIEMDIVADWTLADDTEAHYALNRSGLTPHYMLSFNSVLDKLDGNINWDDYDQDGDGFIDSLIILHSGYAGEASGGRACGDELDNKKRIWSHAIGWIRNDPWESADGRVKVGTYMTTSAMHGACSADVARIGTSTHELIHTWGVPDLYDSNGFIGKGTGVFDIMGHPYGVAGDSLHPGSLGAWSRIELNWLQPTILNTNGKYSLPPIQTSGQVYRIDQGFPEGEYLLIENRQPMLWDMNLWNGGILIWHIDENARRQKFRGYPGQEGWPGNGNHYRVALLQADRQYHLEEGENSGDGSDFFVKGMSELRAGPGVGIATDASLYPNSDSYQRGDISVTGIRIFDFSVSQEVMTFSVAGLAPAVPSPPPKTPPPTPPPSTAKPSNTPTASPSLRPTAPLSTGPPTFTMQPTNDNNATGTVDPSPASGDVNVGLAVGLTLLFTFLAVVVGCLIWRKYYRKLPDKGLIMHTRETDPMSRDEEGVEVIIGLEYYPGEAVSDSKSSTVKIVALNRQASVASTESSGSSLTDNSTSGENDTATDPEALTGTENTLQRQISINSDLESGVLASSNGLNEDAVQPELETPTAAVQDSAETSTDAKSIPAIGEDKVITGSESSADIEGSAELDRYTACRPAHSYHTTVTPVETPSCIHPAPLKNNSTKSTETNRSTENDQPNNQTNLLQELPFASWFGPERQGSDAIHPEPQTSTDAIQDSTETGKAVDSDPTNGEDTMTLESSTDISGNVRPETQASTAAVQDGTKSSIAANTNPMKSEDTMTPALEPSTDMSGNAELDRSAVRKPANDQDTTVPPKETPTCTDLVLLKQNSTRSTEMDQSTESDQPNEPTNLLKELPFASWFGPDF